MNNDILKSAPTRLQPQKLALEPFLTFTVFTVVLV